MTNETTLAAPLLALSSEDLRAILRDDRERTLAEWQRRQAPRKLTSAEAAARCGRLRADGTPNKEAFKTFLARNPDLPRERAGRRLIFDEAALERWLAERQSRSIRRAVNRGSAHG